MKRKIEIDIEPLSDARWTKIDDAVFAALDGEAGVRPAPRPTPRRAVWILSAAVLAAAAAGGLYFSDLLDSREARVAEPSHIETGAAPSHLALGFASIEVGADSAVTASGDDARGMLLVLERGSVDCEVVPRRGRPPFVVQAGDVRVRVVGTRFIVRRRSDPSGAIVEVKRGTVEVARGGETVVLHDGDQWPAQPPVPPASALALPPVEPPPASSEKPGTRSARPPASVHGDAMSDQRAYEQAIRNEGKDPEGSLAIYRRMVASGGPWAPNALFAAGRLSAERGQHAEARRLLEQYLARYPGGANAEDARKLLAGLR